MDCASTSDKFASVRQSFWYEMLFAGSDRYSLIGYDQRIDSVNHHKILVIIVYMLV